MSKDLSTYAEMQATQQYVTTGTKQTQLNDVNKESAMSIGNTTNITRTKLPKIDTDKLVLKVLDTSTVASCNPSPSTNSIYKPVHKFCPNAPVAQNALMPEGFEFDLSVGKGIRKLAWDDQANKMVPAPYLDKALVIKTIFTGEFGKSNEKLELSYYEPYDRSERSFIVDREVLAKESTITYVNRYGYAITYERGNSEAKKLMRYLKQYEEVNYYTISRQAMSQKLGFDKDYHNFALYSPKVTIVPDGAEQKKLFNAPRR